MKKNLIFFSFILLLSGCNVEKSTPQDYASVVRVEPLVQNKTSFEEVLYEEIKTLREENRELKNLLDKQQSEVELLKKVEIETEEDIDISEAIQISNEAFQKNRECFSHKKHVESEWAEGIKAGGSIDTIFYSSKANSCLYVYKFNNLQTGISVRHLVDVFTGDFILETYSDVNKSDFYKFDDNVAEYKN